MGFQYGSLLKNPLLKFQEQIKPYISKIITNKLYQYYINNMPIKYCDFFRGASEGSSISYDNLLLGACFDIINSGCSSILAKIDSNGSYSITRQKSRQKNYITKLCSDRV